MNAGSVKDWSGINVEMILEMLAIENEILLGNGNMVDGLDLLFDFTDCFEAINFNGEGDPSRDLKNNINFKVHCCCTQYFLETSF